MAMMEEKMAGNGFPKLDLHDLKDVWKLGNMAIGWARQPLALNSEQLTMYQELCKRYGLEPAEVLMEYQKIVFGENADPHQSDQSEHALLPDDRGSGPRPTPHLRAGEATAVQTAVGTLDSDGEPWAGQDHGR